MRKVRTRLAVVSISSMLLGFLVYSIPLVKYLIWLNAGAVSAWYGAPKFFVCIAYLMVLNIVSFIWLGLWKLGSSIYDR